MVRVCTTLSFDPPLWSCLLFVRAIQANADEDLLAVFMTQLMPSGTFNFRSQLKSLVYGALR